MSEAQRSSGGVRKMSATWGPPVVVVSAIFLLSSLRASSFPKHPEILNVAVHGTEFLILAFLVARALTQSGLTMGFLETLLWATVICTTFGVLDELHQFSVPTREFDPVDIFVDTAGSIFGSFLYLRLASSLSHGPDRSEN